MENSFVVLQDFGSFFELFCGYYMLLGISSQLQKYFSISFWLKRSFDLKENQLAPYIKDYNKLLEAKNLSKNTGLKKKTSDCFNLKGVAQITCILNSAYDLCMLNIQRWWETISAKEKKYEKVQQKLKREKKWLLQELDKNRNVIETDLYKILTPMYLFFGVNCFFILLLMGFYEKWNKGLNLGIINLFSLGILVVSIFKIWKLYRWNAFKNPIPRENTIIYGIFLHAIFILIPISWLLPLLAIGSYLLTSSPVVFIGFIGHGVVNESLAGPLSETMVFLAVAFPLIPLLIHIILLNRIFRLLRKSERLFRKIYTPFVGLHETNEVHKFYIPEDEDEDEDDVIELI